MVKIITGKIDSEKTTKLLSVYREKNEGDGFALPKLYSHNQIAGQRLVRLSTKENVVFSLKKSFLPEHWNEAYSYDDYSFSIEGRAFFERGMEHMLLTGASPIFLDEIGPLELEGKGFASALRKLLTMQVDLIIVVRDSCFEDVIRQFHITDYTLVPVDRFKLVF